MPKTLMIKPLAKMVCTCLMGSLLIMGSVQAADSNATATVESTKSSITAPKVEQKPSLLDTIKEKSSEAKTDALPIAPKDVDGANNPRAALSAEFDPIRSPRVYEISKELRCLVCQNESIAESTADLALDLRREVIRLVDEGKTNDEIIHYMTDRYGDYVLYKPPFKAKTYLLWLGPLGFIVVGLFILLSVVRRRKDNRAEEESQSFTEALALVRAREFDDKTPEGSVSSNKEG